LGYNSAGHRIDIAPTDTWNSCATSKTTFLFVSSEGLKEDINEKRKFVHFHGVIKYKDVFQSEADLPHETTFGYRWEVGADVHGDFPKIGEGRWTSEWVENPAGANRES
jgi:hypothetical protein